MSALKSFAPIGAGIIVASTLTMATFPIAMAFPASAVAWSLAGAVISTAAAAVGSGWAIKKIFETPRSALANITLGLGIAVGLMAGMAFGPALAITITSGVSSALIPLVTPAVDLVLSSAVLATAAVSSFATLAIPVAIGGGISHGVSKICGAVTDKLWNIIKSPFIPSNEAYNQAVQEHRARATPEPPTTSVSEEAPGTQWQDRGNARQNTPNGQETSR